MEKKNLICICCPLGCSLEIAAENAEVITIAGHSCSKGKIYGVKEFTVPTRILTTTVEVQNGFPPVVAVKTQTDIPKDKLFSCMKELKEVRLQAPVFIGDIVLEDIANTGVKVIATSNCELKLE